MSTNRKRLEGIISAIHTPFTQDYELNEDAARININFQIEEGINGIMVGGSSGEFMTLSLEERKRIGEVAVEKARGRIPVIVHTGHSSTEVAKELTKHASDVGADYAMAMVPPATGITQEEMFEFYKTIASVADIPIVIYNNPGRSGRVIEPQTISRLADIDNIVALKDSGRDMPKTMEIIAKVNGKLDVLSGETDLLLPILSIGGVGAVLVTSLVAPKPYVEMYTAFKRGDIKKAIEIHYKYTPLRKALAMEGKTHAAAKAALEMLGRPAGPTRKPLLPISEKNRQEIKRVLQELNLLPKGGI